MRRAHKIRTFQAISKNTIYNLYARLPFKYLLSACVKTILQTYKYTAAGDENRPRKTFRENLRGAQQRSSSIYRIRPATDSAERRRPSNKEQWKVHYLVCYRAEGGRVYSWARDRHGVKPSSAAAGFSWASFFSLLYSSTLTGSRTVSSLGPLIGPRPRQSSVFIYTFVLYNKRVTLMHILCGLTCWELSR